MLRSFVGVPYPSDKVSVYVRTAYEFRIVPNDYIIRPVIRVSVGRGARRQRSPSAQRIAGLCWRCIYYTGLSRKGMAIKQITDLVNIGGVVTESAANTYTEATIGINLSPVNRQVFVITDTQFTSFEPENIPLTQTEVNMQITKTTQTQMIGANNPDLVARLQKITVGGVAEFSMINQDFSHDRQSTGGRNDYLMILATEDSFIGVVGANNVGAKGASCRVTGYFATADAATYQALVLSELQG
jgi:hypothetical protein